MAYSEATLRAKAIKAKAKDKAKKALGGKVAQIAKLRAKCAGLAAGSAAKFTCQADIKKASKELKVLRATAKRKV